MSKNVSKKWYIYATKAESWAGKHGSPNVHIDSTPHETLDSARNDIRGRIGHITSNPLNKLEWISWLTNKVELRFNYENEGAGTVHQTYILEIQEIDYENGVCHTVEVGY